VRKHAAKSVNKNKKLDRVNEQTCGQGAEVCLVFDKFAIGLSWRCWVVVRTGPAGHALVGIQENAMAGKTEDTD